ncbi:LutC/YkgG family protein [Fictibacillus fluitans]|uniref:Lactate utilization protein C n=1 Tax=Fictibacillus fluitans TaxID=3058422 RepID=A0ABT8HQA0_9BACL|nr:lactate utilization protein C [Fictibacillus sp. NE201]MDN4522953.1 lactate utilization protein C [Fictibacillus sp. NE201]
MRGTIKNQSTFLANIAHRLGREAPLTKPETPAYQYKPQQKVLQGASQDELVEVLKEHCTKINTDFLETNLERLPQLLKEVIMLLGGGPVIRTKDKRFEDYGLLSLLEEELPKAEIPSYEWNAEIGEENILLAERSNVGMTFSEMTLAESATVVLYSSRDIGRSVSLLPTTYVAIIPKSTIVPRMTQAAKVIREKVRKGEVIPSCINYITGPSNSADIEMNLVVGVHGPVKAVYILVEDK